jgi:hypothetical protein
MGLYDKMMKFKGSKYRQISCLFLSSLAVIFSTVATASLSLAENKSTIVIGGYRRNKKWPVLKRITAAFWRHRVKLQKCFSQGVWHLGQNFLMM